MGLMWNVRNVDTEIRREQQNVRELSVMVRTKEKSVVFTIDQNFRKDLLD